MNLLSRGQADVRVGSDPLIERDQRAIVVPCRRNDHLVRRITVKGTRQLRRADSHLRT